MDWAWARLDRATLSSILRRSWPALTFSPTSTLISCDLAGGLGVGFEVVQRLDFTVGGEGPYEILIADIGDSDADPLAGEGADRVDGEDDQDDG